MKKDFLEMTIYGLAALFSGSLFFFGLLYPSYVYTEDVCQVTAPYSVEGSSLSQEEFDRLTHKERLAYLEEMDGSQFQYKSRIWECIQEMEP